MASLKIAALVLALVMLIVVQIPIVGAQDDSAWDGPVKLNIGGYASHPVVATNGETDLVVWMEGDSTDFELLSRSRVDGTWGEQRIALSSYGWVSDLVMRMDHAGNAILVWKHAFVISEPNNAAIIGMRYSVGSGWGSPDIIDPQEGNKYYIDMDMADDGYAMVCYIQIPEGGDWKAMTVSFDPEQGWGDPAAQQGDLQNLVYAQLDMNANGEAIIVSMCSVENPVGKNIYAATYQRSTGWEAPTLVGHSEGGSLMPGVGLSGTGMAMVFWSEDNQMFSNRYEPGTGWIGEVQLTAEDTEPVGFVEVAINDVGDASIAWRSGSSGVYAMAFYPEFGWGLLHKFTDKQVFYTLYLTMSNSGSGTLLWIEHDIGDNFVIGYTRYMKGFGWGNVGLIDDGSKIMDFEVAMDKSGDLVLAYRCTAFSNWYIKAVVFTDLYLDIAQVDGPVNGPVYTITGKATPGKQLLIDGVEVQVGENGSFSSKVLLNEGSNTIKVVLIDQTSGAESTSSVTVDYQDDRLDDLESQNGLILIIAFIALAVAIMALVLLIIDRRKR